jgi:glycosyltransferase involved in cell wall biosynthesis
MSKEVFLSIVVPVYNEAESIPLFWKRLRPVLDEIKSNSEIIFVDDGSSDRTVDEAKAIDDPRVRILSLSRNFGHMVALDAGFRASRGRWTLTIDGDLQHPPELITQMLSKAQDKEVDVVSTRLNRRVDTNPIKKLVSFLYYPILRGISGIPIEDSVGDFRLISRRVVDVITRIPPGAHVYRILIPSLGFPTTSISFEPDHRMAGKSKYTFRKMAQLALDSVLANSQKLFRLLITLSLAATVFAIIFLGWTIMSWVLGDTEPGWASLVLLLILGSTVQISLLVYLGFLMQKMSLTLMGIPHYLVEENIR